MFGLCSHCLLPVPVLGCRVLWHGPRSSFFCSLIIPFLEPFSSLDRVLVSQSFAQLWLAADSPFSPIHAILSPCQLSMPMLPASPTARQVSTSTIRPQCPAQAPCALCHFYSAIGIWTERPSKKGPPQRLGEISPFGCCAKD